MTEYTPSLTMTELARKKLAMLLSQAGNENSKLRIFVEGGGCSGFKYGFILDKSQNADDTLVSGAVLVDCMSIQLLQGATLNYRETLQESGFTIENPQAKSTCGCGASFAIE